MFVSRWTLASTLVFLLSSSANAQVEADAALLANRYRLAMDNKSYGFLSKEELLRRQEVVARFVISFLVEPLDEPTRAAILDGIDRCVARLYRSPAGKVYYGNGAGSGVEEWMYLNDRAYFLTFQCCLWTALTNRHLTPAETQRRDIQHQWVRNYLTKLPLRTSDTLSREGVRVEDVRTWALAELEKKFADPLDLLSQPMPDESFAKLQNRFERFSNGIINDLHDMQDAALSARFTSTKDPSARFGFRYTGELPFRDTVVDLLGNGPSLHFASNADFRGHHGWVSSRTSYDVARCFELQTVADPRGALARQPGSSPIVHGDLSLSGTDLVGLRGAKIAKVPIKNWFEADRLSDKALRTLVHDVGVNRLSIKDLPRMNGWHRGDRSEGEFFIVVENCEGRLAVINLHNYEFRQLMLWCRPRS